MGINPSEGSVWLLRVLRYALAPQDGQHPDPKLFSPHEFGTTEAQAIKAIREHRVSTILTESPLFCLFSLEIQNQIFAINLAETVAAMQLVQEVDHLCTVMSDVGIRCIVVKGVALAAVQGRRPTFRGAGDIDLWVHESDVLAAWTLLENTGWSRGSQTTLRIRPEHGWRYSAWRRFVPATPFSRAGSPDIDLHWRLAKSNFHLDLDFESAWRDSLALPSIGASVRTLSGVDSLKHICAHGVKHSWSVLRDICDVSLTARACDPHEVRELAKADRVVNLSLATSSLVDPSIADLCKPNTRDEHLANLGLAESLSLRNRLSTVSNMNGTKALVYRKFTRPLWRIRTSPNMRGRLHVLADTLLPLRVLGWGLGLDD